MPMLQIGPYEEDANQQAEAGAAGSVQPTAITPTPYLRSALAGKKPPKVASVSMGWSEGDGKLRVQIRALASSNPSPMDEAEQRTAMATYRIVAMARISPVVTAGPGSGVEARLDLRRFHVVKQSANGEALDITVVDDAPPPAGSPAPPTEVPAAALDTAVDAAPARSESSAPEPLRRAKTAPSRRFPGALPPSATGILIESRPPAGPSWWGGLACCGRRSKSFPVAGAEQQQQDMGMGGLFGGVFATPVLQGLLDRYQHMQTQHVRHERVPAPAARRSGRRFTVGDV